MFLFGCLFLSGGGFLSGGVSVTAASLISGVHSFGLKARSVYTAGGNKTQEVARMCGRRDGNPFLL